MATSAASTEEIERCELLGDDLVLMMIDLDDFKVVNDRYSHTMGDAVLVETAAAIRSVVREDELVVRRGGDEFVVVCAPEPHGRPRRTSRAESPSAIADARMQLTPDLPAGATVTAVMWHRNEPSDNADAARRRSAARGKDRRKQRLDSQSGAQPSDWARTTG